MHVHVRKDLSEQKAYRIMEPEHSHENKKMEKLFLKMSEFNSEGLTVI